MAENKVCLLETSMVLPATPTLPQLLFLSSLDLFWREIHYNQRVLFYDSCSADFASLVRDLQQSLSAVLVHFYPCAGRLAKGDDGRFVVDCNDAGVEFVQASIDASLTELGEGFQFRPFYKELARWGDLTRSDRSDVPLLSVQVTKFLDGGISLGITLNHVIMDGHSLWHFMVSWAECARGVPISRPPVHTRTALKVENPSAKKARIYFKLMQHSGVDSTPPELVERVFHFSGEIISRLKSMAETNGSARSFSSFETLNAHCWKRVTIARELKPEEKVHLVVLANCRKRLVPPLPDSYFGNVIQSMLTKVTRAGEVVEESLGVTAGRVREAIEGCNNQTLREMMEWLELRDNLFGGFAFESVGMLVASSPRFPVYEVDFGWGRPSAARPVRLGGEGEICLFPGVEGKGSVDVCLKLQLPVMERLHQDPSFLLLLSSPT